MANSSSGASAIKYVLFQCFFIISGLMDVASKQMPDYVPQIKYDVFVNFRGDDIRRDFLGHLTKELRRKQIHAFVDDKLKTGDELWPSFVEAIQGSLISLTILSENYASSSWSLNELVTILECREKYNRIVIPVFYKVYPTDVRHQNGSYKSDFAEHEKKYNLATVQNWRHALSKAANLSGIKSFNYKTEVELLEKITESVNLELRRLRNHPHNLKGVIGMEKPIQSLESLIRQKSINVNVIGIWGMGGIGKTTIAEAMFNKLYSEYNASCFLANMKEEYGRRGIISLREKLFSTLLVENEKMNEANGLSEYIVRRIAGMKVLIVLDDVNHSDLLEELFGDHHWFGAGSTIIITSRDKQVLIANKVDDIYEVGALNSSQALELFSLYAFKKNHFDMEYDELSKRVVNYANGIPLVLKVLGRLLCGKDKEVWESQLDKLKSMPNKHVYNAMKLSYDDLDRKEKNIFLDLSCFFIGLNLKVDHIKLLLKDSESDNSVVAGLERLKDKALITISENNVVSMHNVIQEMAWEIVRGESIEHAESRSRLIDPVDICDVLENNKGTEAIRSIRADLSVFLKLKFSPHIFTKMSKLQFLSFTNKHDEDDIEFLPNGLQSFPDELRYLHWRYYPLKSLPENFSAEKLVILDMSNSQLEKLWDGVQNLVNLREVKVCDSKNLKELPDLTQATNLEELDISACPQLTSVNPSIFSLNKLQRLNIGYCYITKVVSNNHLSSLRYLSLGSCPNLEEFSVTSENMIELDLSYTRVNALPSSFGRQSKLKLLRLGSTDIKKLPSSFKNLTALQYLSVELSRQLHTLTELPPSLETLDATGCVSLKTVLFPSIAQQFKENRRDVRFWNCLNLDEHSRKAIGLNARINAMKSAHQHLSAPDQNYNNYSRKYRFYQVKYVYPGRKIPEWFEYQTRDDYIMIDLPSTPRSSQLGFIFSFVISYPLHRTVGYFSRFTFHIIISDDGGYKSEKSSINIYMSALHLRPNSKHVCVIYDQRCSRYLNSRAENKRRLKIEVEVMGDTHPEWGAELEAFGVSVINTSAYHNFVQQINTSSGHNFIQHIGMSDPMHSLCLKSSCAYPSCGLDEDFD
ncbi:hypothetical protein GYH30_006306 [Glycine max]|uniref:ADP-ribosyl cyclase/cyclic ADP-ribose hydrolase n=1 Tax=Glycine soja TaxID=3848 RepID=A0A0B2P5X1_GLYSO|nr:disease resistance protein RML1B-like [Glycine soja]XP_028224443.1 disease resistance protein RML1B-like [Glycine soja]XP_028224444.1 disease resistance protein RML1B-like [Glycine soja]XP_028224445.1 disease resistance protein RML1B-like [Glycine soja]XP_028224446.1 disease resistance protein RML1B-like [Glycine soja]XP_028224447.1 disease resistance protein RML1B-like [Glycine soja]KAH1068665.1 hypothetical protein GYH30_006306 [Glycine max]KAH1068666.1 hypothetical protein GYH30_006306